MPETVVLRRMADYSEVSGSRRFFEDLETLAAPLSPGAKVLIKPNLVAARHTPLACTHPAVVREVGRYFRQAGCRVTVGDSPAFGSASGVARRCGYGPWLRDEGMPIVTLDRPVAVDVSWGERVGISRRALEADLIVNVGKLKAHGQMRLTACIKNLFGCVSGVRKGLAHARYGERGTRFEDLLLEVALALPPTLHVLDGVQVLHRWGPTHGTPLDFGLLGVAADGFALDAAAYTAVGMDPEAIPLWRAARRRRISGAWTESHSYPVLAPSFWQDQGFEVPATLNPVSFRPAQLARSLLRRIWFRIRDRFNSGLKLS